MKRVTTLLLIGAVMMVFISSCATTAPQVQPTRRYTWPRSSDEPRIEWLGIFASDKQLRTAAPKVLSLLIGEENSIKLERPIGVTANSKGTVFVSEHSRGRFVEFNFREKDVRPVLDADTAQSIATPFALSVDAEDNLYVSDDFKRKIHVISPERKIIKVIDLSATVGGIGFFTVDKKRKRLVVPDFVLHKVVVLTLDGRLLFTIGGKGSGDGQMNRPNAVAVEKDGSIVVAETFNARVQRFTADGAFINKFGKRGDAEGEFGLIKGIAVDSEDHIYVTDARLNRVTIFSKDGVGLMTFGDAYPQGSKSATVLGIGGFNGLQSIYIDEEDRIYISDQYNNSIQIFQYLNKDYLKMYPLSGPARSLL